MRHYITYIPQGNTMMSGTIRENMLLANPDATRQQMEEALYTAAADFVEKMPQGIDTQIGEHATLLSEGQAQRLAIARGLLHGAEIVGIVQGTVGAPGQLDGKTDAAAFLGDIRINCGCGIFGTADFDGETMETGEFATAEPQKTDDGETRETMPYFGTVLLVTVVMAAAFVLIYKSMAKGEAHVELISSGGSYVCVGGRAFVIIAASRNGGSHGGRAD